MMMNYDLDCGVTVESVDCGVLLRVLTQDKEASNKIQGLI